MSYWYKLNYCRYCIIEYLMQYQGQGQTIIGVFRELINLGASTFSGVSIQMSVRCCSFLPLFLSYSMVRLYSIQQLRHIQGGEYSVTSDVWSLGIMLFELATGWFPLAANNKGQHEPSLLQEMSPTFLPFPSRMRVLGVRGWSSRGLLSRGACLRETSQVKSSHSASGSVNLPLLFV